MKTRITPERYKEVSRNDNNSYLPTNKRGNGVQGLQPNPRQYLLDISSRISDLQNDNLTETNVSRSNLRDSSTTFYRDSTTIPYNAFNEKNSESNKTNIKQKHSYRNPKEYKRGYCCEYFKTRSGCCFTWMAIFIVLLGSLGFLGYYYRPIFPKFVIGSPYIPLNSKGLVLSRNESFSTLLKEANETNPFIMGITYAVNISIVSEMKMNLDISVIRLAVIIKLIISGIFQIAEDEYENKQFSWQWKCDRC
jgi:hypothetical protein